MDRAANDYRSNGLLPPASLEWRVAQTGCAPSRMAAPGMSNEKQ